MEALLGFLKPIIETYAPSLPAWAITIFTIMGASRFVFKPLIEIARGYVAMTPSKKDDEVVEEIIESKIFKSIRFVLDWMFSIKLPKKK